jgi:hypothetical protein
MRESAGSCGRRPAVSDSTSETTRDRAADHRHEHDADQGDHQAFEEPVAPERDERAPHATGDDAPHADREAREQRVERQRDGGHGGRAVAEPPDHDVDAEVDHRPHAERPPAGEDGRPAPEVPATDGFGQRILQDRSQQDRPEQRHAQPRARGQRGDDVAGTHAGRGGDQSGADERDPALKVCGGCSMESMTSVPMGTPLARAESLQPAGPSRIGTGGAFQRAGPRDRTHGREIPMSRDRTMGYAATNPSRAPRHAPAGTAGEDATPARDADASGGSDARWLCLNGRRTTFLPPVRAPVARLAVAQPRG